MQQIAAFGPAAKMYDGADKGPSGGKAHGLKSVLEGLEDLWDADQYAEEFSLHSFTSRVSAPK